MATSYLGGLNPTLSLQRAFLDFRQGEQWSGEGPGLFQPIRLAQTASEWLRWLKKKKNHGACREFRIPELPS